MISVIVPIYNAQYTLRQCIDSILAQTYRDLEILLIDDGSADDSGEIAEEYLSDSRVRVFHKGNGGLSSARNYGLDKAGGDYIAFVDADDWIEPETYKTVMAHIADICVFGRSVDRPGERKSWKPAQDYEVIDGSEAVHRLIVDGSLRHALWDKVYRKEIFRDIRFPEGSCYEDIRLTYRLLAGAEKVSLMPDVFYHYRQYEGSIAHNRSAANMLDYWSAYYGLYLQFCGYGEEYRKACIRQCSGSVSRVWGSLWKAEKAEQKDQRIQQIVSFARQYRKEKMKRRLKIVMILAAAGTRWSMLCACIFEKLCRRHRPPKKLYRMGETEE